MSSTRPTAGSRPGRVRPLRALAFALLLALSGGMAAADQNDPELSALFARLQQDLTPEEAAEVDRRIWLLWLHSEDKTVNRLMAQGMIAMQRGALDRALDRFNDIVERAPDFAEGWNKRATVLYMMGRHRESVADVQQVLNLEPRHYGALSGLGMILVALGREEDALEWLGRALELNPYLDGIRVLSDRIGERLKGKRI
ncbi:MAG: tetratricopeptide repeat protein [Alphaproteobacteria bacterium]|nr:tetratricopeptide repeat protein [Alphaproteobacteria bacterium]